MKVECLVAKTSDHKPLVMFVCQEKINQFRGKALFIRFKDSCTKEVECGSIIERMVGCSVNLLSIKYS